MNQTISLGKFRGIPIGMNWSVVVVAMLLGFSVRSGLAQIATDGSARWAPVASLFVVVSFFASIVAHEIGHAVVALRSGVGVRRITLWFLGGLAEIESPMRRPGWEIAVAAAGPVVSLLCGVVFGAIGFASAAASGPVVLTAAAAWLAAINVVLAVFNMLPGLPLDGGRVLAGVIWAITKKRSTGDLFAAVTGVVVGAALITWGLWSIANSDDLSGVWPALMGMFLFNSARTELNATQLRRSAEGVTVADVMTNRRAVRSWMTVGALRADGGVDEAAIVENFDGTVAGVVTAGALAAVPDDARDHVTVAQITAPFTDGVQRDVSVEDLIVTHGLPATPIPVLDGTAVVGLVGGRDLVTRLGQRHDAR